jgi:hypothetical protein
LGKIKAKGQGSMFGLAGDREKGTAAENRMPRKARASERGNRTEHENWPGNW